MFLRPKKVLRDVVMMEGVFLVRDLRKEEADITPPRLQFDRREGPNIEE
jgi:hypothetical protein